MKKIYLILLFGFTISWQLVAQVTYYNNEGFSQPLPIEKIRIENIDVTQIYDTINLSFDITVEPNAIKSGSSLYLIPSISNSKDEMTLPSILVNGKKRARYYNRELLLKGQKSPFELFPDLTITTDKKHAKHVHYSYSFIISPDMDGSELRMVRILEDCCKYIPEGSQRLLSERIRANVAAEFTDMDLSKNVVFIEPEQETVKKRAAMFQAHIDYPVNIHEVRPSFKNNLSELNRIDREISPLMNNGDIYKIKGIRIDGFASPEGAWQHNDALARNRANGFWTYMRGRYPRLSGVQNINIVSHSEDWDGLVKMIKEEPMPYDKNEILNIIQYYGIFEGRESKLMMLSGGGPYRYMLNNFFPKLRRMEITIEYDVKEFDNQEAAEIVQTRPGDLSQYEMIRLSRSQGSDILSTYDFIALHFPNDPVAIINVSSVELIRGNLDKAWKYLSQVSNDPRAFNNIGVYYMAKGDIETAKSYFRAAMGYDKSKASYNLKLIEDSNSLPGVQNAVSPSVLQVTKPINTEPNQPAPDYPVNTEPGYTPPVQSRPGTIETPRVIEYYKYK